MEVSLNSEAQTRRIIEIEVEESVTYVMQHAKTRLFEEIEQLDIITYSYRGHP